MSRTAKVMVIAGQSRLLDDPLIGMSFIFCWANALCRRRAPGRQPGRVLCCECDLAWLVQRVLAETGLAGALLDLELTESQAMQELDNVIATLNTLREMGVSAALDDFGTGYSSLAYLKRFAIDRLKIDRSFVQCIASEPSDAAIATTVIAMAHSLNLRVVAEGVETKGQLDYLRSHGCDEMQGFLFSRPLPADAFAQLLREEPRLSPQDRWR